MSTIQENSKMLSVAAVETGQCQISVVGLGYVGLPLLCEFARTYKVVGFDISERKISELRTFNDTTGEVNNDDLKQPNITFTTVPKDLQASDVIIVTVPTPIDGNNKPDLTALTSASRMIGKQLRPGQIVVYESTVYPGVTEDVCIPILEQESGLTFNKDFYAGYSPERISPGETNRTLRKVVKIVSGSTEATKEVLIALYSKIVDAGIHPAASIKVAEAAKVIENTQRDLNVALMNEIAIIFHKMGINTLDVIDAAASKWNFMRMTPGLVGGHCIGVDPYYLTYKAESLGYNPEVILAGRRINDGMGAYVAQQTVKLLIKSNKYVKGAKILMMGLTFKENVSDIRNSKVVDIIDELKEFGIDVIIHDPHALAHDAEEEYGVQLTAFDEIPDIDGIILGVPHDAFSDIDQSWYINKLGENGILVDVKSFFKANETLSSLPYYWTL